MIAIHARLPTRPAAASGAPARLCLPFERRQKSRQRAVLASGEEVAIELPRGEVMRGGDWLLASDGRAVEVVAEPEQVLHVVCGTPEGLARAAYHLGNRHVPVQVGDAWLRIVFDHVLEDMLRGLGARTSRLEAPFEPEAGAYGGHGHSHASPSRAARIHDFSLPALGEGPGEGGGEGR